MDGYRRGENYPIIHTLPSWWTHLKILLVASTIGVILSQIVGGESELQTVDWHTAANPWQELEKFATETYIFQLRKELLATQLPFDFDQQVRRALKEPIDLIIPPDRKFTPAMGRELLTRTVSQLGLKESYAFVLRRMMRPSEGLTLSFPPIDLAAAAAMLAENTRIAAKEDACRILGCEISTSPFRSGVPKDDKEKDQSEAPKAQPNEGGNTSAKTTEAPQGDREKPRIASGASRNSQHEPQPNPIR